MVAMGIFALVAVLQALRVVLDRDVMINGEMIPAWVSLFVCAVTTTMVIGLWREAHHH